MLLNPDRMYKIGVIYNLGDSSVQIQQNGVDLRCMEIYDLVSDGTIFKDKSIISERKSIIPTPCAEGVFWCLSPGYYGITFHEGVKLPAHVSAEIKVKPINSSPILTSSDTFAISFSINFFPPTSAF